MNLTSKMHWPRVLVVLFLFVLALTVGIYKDDAKQIIRSTLESGFTAGFVWIYVAIAVVSKNLFLGAQRSHFFETATELMLSISGYGLAAATSITLLKGAYLQYFYNAHYFSNFNDLDLGSIFVVSAYLLIYTGIVTTKMLIGVLFRASGAESTEPYTTGQANNQGGSVGGPASIDSAKPIKVDTTPQNVVITTAQTYTCAHCGFGYHLNNPFGPNAASIGATTTCPKCGNVEIVKSSWQI